MKEQVSVTTVNYDKFSYYFDSFISIIPLIVLIIIIYAIVKLYKKLIKFLDKNS